jgi:peptidoglycan/LPS O-acetylase OafA/YrhL/glycosyltransferase involved in cell wall biosynthesis
MRVMRYAPARHPTVDVFLPTAGEPLEVLENTYHHVAALDWPAQLIVWVLDDAGRPEVEELATSHGFAYRSRPDRGRLKKAGNLRYGYEQSTGDLIAIFDADFVPRPDFLSELVPYFEQDDVGIVQSPQFFDAVKGMPWLQRCAGATQELFYRWIQPARDRSRAAICVGSCAVYRRSALDASGGFAQIGHSEDVHTGVQMMKAGFQLRYVPILVSKGICPDSALAFVNQQYRWCTGSMSLLADRSFHTDPHIRPRQRLCFWAGFLYYITTAVNVFTSPLPALAMLWLLPRYVYPHNSVWLLGALAMWMVVLPLTFRARWRLDVLRVQNLYSFAHAVAIWHVLRGRTRDWVATGTADRSRGTPVGASVLRLARGWVALTQTVIWVGLAVDIARFGIERFWAMTAFALLAGYVHLPILALRASNGSPRAAAADALRAARASLAAPFIKPGAASREATHLPGPAGSSRIPRQRRPEEFSGPPAAAPEDSAGQPRLRAFRPDIQGLRAIAVSLVVLYHAHVPGIRGGYVGVDVFFVISGFLITGGLLRQLERAGRISFRKFYAGRVRRLALPAALVVVVTLVGVRLWDSIFQVRGVTTDALYTAFYAINYRLAAEGVNYQQASGPPSPLQHYWSLAVEEQFYLAWPLVIMLCVWLARRHYRAALWGVICTACAISLYLCVTLTDSNQPLAYFSIQTRAWELGLGALLALGAGRLARLPGLLAAGMSWLGVAGIVGVGIVYTDYTIFPGKAAILPTLATGLVIAGGCRPVRYSAELLLDLRPAQGIGKVSYSWYLWHWPLLVIVPMRIGYRLSWFAQLEVVLLALWLATLSYFLVETPARRTRWSGPAWLSTGVSTVGVTVVAALAIAASVPALVGSGSAVDLAAAADTGQIEHSVAVGTLTVAAPRNLVPALTQAKTDQPSSTHDGCHAGFLVVQQGPCVYGDPAGAHTMILVGDSHAQQWLPGLDIEAKRLGWKLVAWTKAACPLADLSVHAPQLGNRSYTECDQWRRITLGRIEGTHPDVVLAAQSDSVPGLQYSNAQWADATARTLGRIRAAGTPVVYLMDTPVPRVDVPDCIANNLAKIQPCMFVRSQAYSFAGRHEEMAATLKAASITALDPVDWFCMARKCPVVIGNIMVYRDASHMSTPYSRYLAPATRPLFVPKKQ